MIIEVAFAFQVAAAALAGQVTADSGEPVAYAFVRLIAIDSPDASAISIVTDSTGQFLLGGLPGGRLQISVSHIAFAEWRDTIDAENTDTLLVRLTSRALQLEPLQVIVPSARSRAEDFFGYSISGSDVLAVPMIGEADVLRSLFIIPAVTPASDFSTALYVRGLGPGHQSIFLDGIRLANPYHFGGFMSSVPAEAVFKVDVFPGVYPASMGGQLGSVVNIETNVAHPDKFEGAGNIGLLSSSALLAIPLPGDVRALVAGRRTYWDLLSIGLQRVGILPWRLPYSFSDLVLRADRSFAGHNVSATAYWTSEGLTSGPGTPLSGSDDWVWNWGTKAASVRYDTGLFRDVRFSGLLTASNFSTTFDVMPGDGSNSRGVQAQSSSDEIRLRASIESNFGGFRARGGVDATRLSNVHSISNPGAILTGILPSFTSSTVTGFVAPFVELNRSWETRSLYMGARVEKWAGHRARPMPRVSFDQRIGNHLTLSLGAGQTTQGTYSLRNEESPYSTLVGFDIVTRIPPDERLPTSNELAAGIFWRPLEQLGLRIEGYARRIQHLPSAFATYAGEDTPLFQTDTVTRGSLNARGIEFSLESEHTSWSVLGSYVFEDQDMEIDAVSFPPRYARRHRGNVWGRARFTEWLDASIRVSASAGNPYTPVASAIETYRLGEDGRMQRVDIAALLGPHNSRTGEDYLRADIEVRGTFYRDLWSRPVVIRPYLQVLNFLNEDNALFTVPEYSRGELTLRSPAQLPTIPTLGIQWEF